MGTTCDDPSPSMDPELRTGNSVGDLAANPGRSEQILLADNHEGR